MTEWAWPVSIVSGAVLVIATIILRRPIGDLVDRISSVTRDGVHTHHPPKLQSQQLQPLPNTNESHEDEIARIHKRHAQEIQRITEAHSEESETHARTHRQDQRAIAEHAATINNLNDRLATVQAKADQDGIRQNASLARKDEEIVKLKQEVARLQKEVSMLTPDPSRMFTGFHDEKPKQ